MRQFYPAAGSIGDNTGFWKTLDSTAAFSDFVFAKLTSYALVIHELTIGYDEELIGLSGFRD